MGIVKIELRIKGLIFKIVPISNCVYLRMIQKVLLILVLSANYTFAQTFNSYYQSIVSNCVYDSLLNNLLDFTSFGVKEIGTQELVDARDWITNKYAQFGYSDVTFDSFTYTGQNVDNIVVTKQGSVYPDTYLIMSAHYDTKNGVGANDNGTGTAILLEMARVLKDIETEYSIKFIHFTAEEVGLVGSQHYVDNVVIPNNMDILLVYNIDEVGGVSGMQNNTITCERDESNPPGNNVASDVATTTLAGCIELYSNLNTTISFAYASDYMPFQANGEIITGLYETNESPFPHTASDIMANLDTSYVFEILQGATGAALEFAIAIEPSFGLEEQDMFIELYPNPVNENINIRSGGLLGFNLEIHLFDFTGKNILNWSLDEFDGRVTLELGELDSGSYLIQIDSDKGRTTRRFIVE